MPGLCPSHRAADIGRCARPRGYRNAAMCGDGPGPMHRATRRSRGDPAAGSRPASGSWLSQRRQATAAIRAGAFADRPSGQVVGRPRGRAPAGWRDRKTPVFRRLDLPTSACRRWASRVWSSRIPVRCLARARQVPMTTLSGSPMDIQRVHAPLPTDDGAT